MEQSNFDDFVEGGRRCPRCGRPLFTNQKRCCAICRPHYDWPNQDGYAMIWRVPFGEKKEKWVPAHRWEMEQYLGRKLASEETVHHKNGKRMDRRFCNLELWPKNHGAGQREHDISWDYYQRIGGATMHKLAYKDSRKFAIDVLGFDDCIVTLSGEDTFPARGAEVRLGITPHNLKKLPCGKKLILQGPRFDATFSIDKGLDVSDFVVMDGGASCFRWRGGKQ